MGKGTTAETFSEEKAIEELTLTLRDLYQRAFNDGFAAAERLRAADKNNPAAPVPDGESVAAVVEAEPVRGTPAPSDTAEKVTPTVQPGPENYRHCLLEPGTTLCGLKANSAIETVDEFSSRVTCPGCLAAVESIKKP